MSMNVPILNALQSANQKLSKILDVGQSALVHLEQHRAAQEAAIEEQKTANLIAYLQLSRTTGMTPLAPVEEQQLEARIRDRLNL